MFLVRLIGKKLMMVVLCFVEEEWCILEERFYIEVLFGVVFLLILDVGFFEMDGMEVFVREFGFKECFVFRRLVG